jgi:hypothetical protein
MEALEAAISLQPGPIKQFTWTTIQPVIEKMEKEQCGYALHAQHFLVTARTLSLLADGKTEEVVKLILPKGDSEKFDPYRPRLIDCACTLPQKLLRFTHCWSQQFVCPMIQKGMSDQVRLLRFCKALMAEVSEFDEIDLDLSESVAFANAQNICEALVQIVEPSLKISAEDLFRNLQQIGEMCYHSLSSHKLRPLANSSFQCCLVP